MIATTNRKDLIDPAVLRPGRFEVHIPVLLPDEKGRIDIFKIHTKELVKNGMLAPDVDLAELARKTKNYTGAEIEGVVRSAQSYCLMRNDFGNLTGEIDFTKAFQ